MNVSTIVHHYMSSRIGYSPAQIGSKLRSWSEVYGLVNDSTTAKGQVTSGDLVQWTDLSGNGNHWMVSVGAPSFDGTKLVFAKANSDGLINTGLFTDSGTDTQGEIIVVAEKITGETIFPFAASRLADINKRCVFGINDADDKLYLQVKDGANIGTGTSPVFLDSGKFIAAYRSNSLTYGIFSEKDGERLDQTLVLSGGDGDWFGDVATENFTCMKLLDSSPVYYSGYVYAILYCNEMLTLQERTDLFCYLNNKYSVWP